MPKTWSGRRRDYIDLTPPKKGMPGAVKFYIFSATLLVGILWASTFWMIAHPAKEMNTSAVAATHGVDDVGH
jgi:hypothetical protein